MNAKAELMPVEPQAVASVPAVMTPAHMLAIAVERGADLDQLQKFMDLNDRWQAAEARKAYVAAMARFKLNAPTILKEKGVSFGDTNYKHATLFAVCDAALKGLAEVGISHRWIPKQEGDRISVTCELTHELGHSESVILTAAADSSGKKNSIQAIGSTVSYLERYTLLAATGLATKDMDNDGSTAEAPPREAPQAPADYEDWKADMTALADEGLQPLQAGWGRSAPDLRQYASMVDKAWWDATKAKARQVPA